MKTINSHKDMEQIIGIMKAMSFIFKEIETFIHQIILDNFDESVTMNLSSKVGIQHSGTIVSLQIYNSETNTNAIYDMTVIDLLKFCVSNTVEVLLNEKIPKLVNKTLQHKNTEDMKTVYLEQTLI